jgi:hypothetical protein
MNKSHSSLLSWGHVTLEMGKNLKIRYVEPGNLNDIGIPVTLLCVRSSWRLLPCSCVADVCCRVAV